MACLQNSPTKQDKSLKVMLHVECSISDSLHIIGCLFDTDQSEFMLREKTMNNKNQTTHLISSVMKSNI